MTHIATANSLIGATAAPPRPAAARTRMLLEGPILPTLLRLSAPNVLNLLAIAGMITFDGLFLGRLGPDTLAGVSLGFPWVMLIQHTAASGNAFRLLASVGGALVAIYWLDLGATGFFVAVAGGFCIYAASTAGALLLVKEPRPQGVK